MTRSLIIKTGATGDVIRTTVLLHALEGEVFWLTSTYNLDILPVGKAGLRAAASVENIPGEWNDLNFDLIINLEEDPQTGSTVALLNSRDRVGVYLKDGKPFYTDNSAGWFDMSLISRLDKHKADELKKVNRKSYQSFLFDMLGKTFRGEKYLLPDFPNPAYREKKAVALEKNAGKRWPNKRWGYYEELEEKLKTAGIEIKELRTRNLLKDYMNEIRSSRFLISGDTLAMHIALGYGIPCLGIFTCTSPWEIYDYGLLTRVVSPRLMDYFYATTQDDEATHAISADEVYQVFKNAFERNLMNEKGLGSVP